MNRLKGDHFERIDFRGGTLYRANKSRFPALRGLAAQKLLLKPGATREPHTHPNAELLGYCISGRARVGIVGPGAQRQLLEVNAGDIAFVPRGYVHWVENVGTDALEFFLVLSHEQPETIELSETLIGIPNETLESVLTIPIDALKRLPERAVTISDESRR